MKINDNLFQQAVSCPLKIFHYREESISRTILPFKQRNKLRLRDAVAFRFNNVKFTSDQTNTAALETEEWLKQENVTICGAVIGKDDFYTRIPVLKKEGAQFSVIQVHGKLRKSSHAQNIQTTERARVTDRYLLKAAYRAEILKQCFPESAVNVLLFFPKRGFRASGERLLQRADRTNIPDKKTLEDLGQLFVGIEATAGVEEMRASMPETVAHSDFAECSVFEALNKIKEKITLPPAGYGLEIHKGCKYCSYRNGKTGCWARFFDRNDISHSYLHVFDLIGHGNNVEAESGFYYQEEVPVQEAFQTFEAVRKAGGKAITIQQRRILQLLKARGEAVPEVWAKPGIRVLQTLNFPLHFIDFEAATYALPMNRNGGAYDPVYFQFSCHTLQENGEITHTEWLDSKPESGYPHQNFVQQLSEVPGIFGGTLVQYSPFEGQALNYLYQEFKKNSMLYSRELSVLEDLKRYQGHSQIPRLFDLSKLIRESYFNSYFDGSLGLKSVLTGILKRMKKMAEKKNFPAEVYDLKIDLFSQKGGGEEPDPYKEIQHPVYQVEDGSEAMQAYISLKSGTLSEEEIKIIPALLKRYCALDSYALFIIFRHLNELCEKMDRDEDLIIFS